MHHPEKDFICSYYGELVPHLSFEQGLKYIEKNMIVTHYVNDIDYVTLVKKNFPEILYYCLYNLKTFDQECCYVIFKILSRAIEVRFGKKESKELRRTFTKARKVTQEFAIEMIDRCKIRDDHVGFMNEGMACLQICEKVASSDGDNGTALGKVMITPAGYILWVLQLVEPLVSNEHFDFHDLNKSHFSFVLLKLLLTQDYLKENIFSIFRAMLKTEKNVDNMVEMLVMFVGYGRNLERGADKLIELIEMIEDIYPTMVHYILMEPLKPNGRTIIQSRTCRFSFALMKRFVYFLNQNGFLNQDNAPAKADLYIESFFKQFNQFQQQQDMDNFVRIHLKSTKFILKHLIRRKSDLLSSFYPHLVIYALVMNDDDVLDFIIALQP
jgi:hypothetical protein